MDLELYKRNYPAGQYPKMIKAKLIEPFYTLIPCMPMYARQAIVRGDLSSCPAFLHV